MSDTATTSEIYDIPQDLKDFRDTIRQIAQEKIAPRAGEIDRSAEYPHDIRDLLGEHDILARPFAEEYGGTGTRTPTVLRLRSPRPMGTASPRASWSKSSGLRAGRRDSPRSRMSACPRRT